MFAFILVIINLGLLGFALGGLVHGVQAAARKAATTAASNYATTGTMSCDTTSTIQGYFNSFADPPLHPAGTNPVVTPTWTNNTTGATANAPPGVYLTLTASYSWIPFGLQAFGHGVTLSISTVLVVPGSSSATTIDASC